MADKPWYKRGAEGRKEGERIDREQKQKRQRQWGPRRFWLETDSSCKVLFLDTPEFFFHEHNLKLDGKWFNYETCVREFDTCPPCEAGNNPAYVVAGTVVAFKKWTDSEDREHKCQKLLFVAKGKARQEVARQLGYRNDNLTMCLYDIARGPTPTETNTGESMNYLRTLTREQVMKVIPEADIPSDYDGDIEKFLQPFDYAKLFKPKTAKELREIVGGETPVGAEDDEVDDDDFAGVLAEADDDDIGSEVMDIEDLM